MADEPSVRVDYEPGDAAPAVTSRVPGASVVVVDDVGRVLVIQREDSGLWALPGGAHDVGESLPETAIRECLEETGVAIQLDGLVGTFTDPSRVFEYRGERPEVRQEFSVLFTGRPVGGDARPTAEARRVAWVTDGELDHLDMTGATRIRVEAWRANRSTGTNHLG